MIHENDFQSQMLAAKSKHLARQNPDLLLMRATASLISLEQVMMWKRDWLINNGLIHLNITDEFGIVWDSKSAAIS